MAGPIAATGAVTSPTKYGALTMGGEQFTGLWTQASPYRDAATPYLTRKFYQGNRFDRIIDGLNREITTKLTDGRRPGSNVYNALTCPAINAFYSWKYIQSGIEQLRVLADCKDGTIRDVTVGNLTTLYTKSVGAGIARFLGIGTELFFGDGVDEKKILRSSQIWKANTLFNAGAFIIDGNGNLQVVQSLTTATLLQSCVAVVPLSPNPAYYFQVQASAALNWPAGTQVTLSGLTHYPGANGLTLTTTNIPIGLTGGLGAAPNVLTFPSPTRSAVGLNVETGSVTAASTLAPNRSGGTIPTWNTTVGGTTADGNLIWVNLGPPIYDWQAAAPTAAPTVTPNPLNRQWEPITAVAQWYSFIDTVGNLQVAIRSTNGTYITGANSPAFGLNLGQLTTDNDVVWVCCGRPTTWLPSTTFQTWACINDSNGNLQVATVAGASGTTPPASWSNTVGATTTDGAVTWTCVGTGTQLLTNTRTYTFAYHTIDGGVTTAAPVASLNPVGSVMGSPGNFYAQLSGPCPADTQIDQIWIFATAQGQPTPLLLAKIPNPSVGTASTWTFVDTLPDKALNFAQAAPIADAGDPPPDGFTGPVYHLQRVWGFVGNIVYYSGGPDTITGNGNTSFPPLNQIVYQSKVLRLQPITVENGGILVFTTGGVFIILGQGTSSLPFYSTSYANKINLGGYDAFDIIGSEIFLMEANRKVSSFRVQYPFDPQSGYNEVGFPIGDQFFYTTTGGFNGQIFNPSTTLLSWNVSTTKESAMYVANGAGQYFRMAMVSPPESGIIWNPIGSITGGSSAIQSVETSPGVWNLLIAPATSGPILQRSTDGTNWADNAVAYPSWDAKGVTLLCSTGQTTEVAHVATKSAAVGARPVISVILGEIAPSTERPWNVLELTSSDPPLTPPSKSVYSDRYALAQNGVADTGDCIMTRFDYGTQAFADELLDWGIYGATDDERKEEAQKV